MSLAPASSRGAFLKARLAVNGIQCAARSLGTLTAAGRWLLSSMGASLSFGTWRLSREVISCVAGRERHHPHYFRSIGRFEGVQRDVQGEDETVRGVSHFDLAVQLVAERLDQPDSKTSPGRLVDRRAARFGPGQMQLVIVRIDGPGDPDAPRGHRQTAQFCGCGGGFG